MSFSTQMKLSIAERVLYGMEGGSFVDCIAIKDFEKALVKADDGNLKDLGYIAKWRLMYLPNGYANIGERLPEPVLKSYLQFMQHLIEDVNVRVVNTTN